MKPGLRGKTPWVDGGGVGCERRGKEGRWERWEPMPTPSPAYPPPPIRFLPKMTQILRSCERLLYTCVVAQVQGHQSACAFDSRSRRPHFFGATASAVGQTRAARVSSSVSKKKEIEGREGILDVPDGVYRADIPRVTLRVKNGLEVSSRLASVEQYVRFFL